MKFAIITHVIHGKESGSYFGYEPYVREMNLWIKNVSEVLIAAPLHPISKSPIQEFYQHQKVTFTPVANFDISNFKNLLRSLIVMPGITWKIYQIMKRADHIHLRCPGNIGLLGCFVQILFPSKSKTAKYAGNWDPKAKQPLTYRLQKWILSNAFLTKNMQVLVYGEWENSSENIKPFFTASYFESDKTEVKPRELKGTISFVFIGTLSNGKQPLFAIKLVEQLSQKGHNVQLTLYGDGSERAMLEHYISENGLDEIIFLKGNQNQETIKKAYIENHFVVLPSLSEGWPKVVAEGMFWACLPIASKVSCVPNMLGNGDRGLLLDLDLNADTEKIEALLNDAGLYQEMAENAMQWSRQFTMDAFENEINLLLQR
ncbi:glycosyltransferase family 4 protein [Flavobacterium wongokense]|uniref:glycosyltransferase family 4 protein n=1 Tax=Flavobacterium wongokense TaxID=2910674 RepID=UPI001F4525F9|nr:glycosyltransferase family 4 protein [Flavobacterium sp. WG47]MCF6132661.1 glycosyltransferase family 4 protein [Flavobacterium sp. WG47]